MAYNTRSSARGATRPSTVVAGRKTHTGRKTATKAASKRTLGGRAAKSAATATKKKAPATHHKRKPGIVDKIAGVVLKVEGAITGRPGVKVLFPPPLQASKEELVRSRLMICCVGYRPLGPRNSEVPTGKAPTGKHVARFKALATQYFSAFWASLSLGFSCEDRFLRIFRRLGGSAPFFSALEFQGIRKSCTVSIYVFG